MDTIFGLSSGALPAAIAIVRLSGSRALEIGTKIAGPMTTPRQMRLASFADPLGDGDTPIDRGLVVHFPAASSVTGEDLVEFHCHGGKAVVRRLEDALKSFAHCRPAVAGEFTRRAFLNGRLDLTEAEGLGDLLTAETELQRRSAMALAEGTFSKTVEDWRRRLLDLSAMVEADLDFNDDDDVTIDHAALQERRQSLVEEIAQLLERPRAEALKEGFIVAIAGPPNSGKSTLFNALLDDDAAITAPIAGTTRDILKRQVAIDGVPFEFVDMAGLRDDSADPIEKIGIDRANRQIENAQLVLWLGEEGGGPLGAWEIETKADIAAARKATADHRVSAVTGEGMDALISALTTHAREALPVPGTVAINHRQADLLKEAVRVLQDSGHSKDPLILGEHLRIARLQFDKLLGRTGVEDVLDTVFGRFCIGK